MAPALRSQILLYIGIAWSNQLERELALESFRRAILESATITLPRGSSPKIAKLFEQAQRQVAAAAPTTAPGDLSSPVPAVDPSTLVADTPPQDPHTANSGSGSSLWRRYWPAWTALGLSLATLGTGVTMGVLSGQSHDKARRIDTPYQQAQSHQDRAKAQALAANILYGVAGAAAVAAGLLFYLNFRADKERSASQAVIVPTIGGGLAFQVTAAWD